MSGKTDNSDRTYSEQLADLEDKLHSDSGDEAILAEMHVAIRTLLAGNSDSAAHIQEILRKRFDEGHLRAESYELVKNMLDRIVADDTASLFATDEMIALTPQDTSAAIDETFSDTAVLESSVVREHSADERLQVGSVLRDRFLLQERISGGSMGVVYKALDRRLAEVDERNPYVAIKVLSSKLSRNGNALQALQQEAAKGRFLSHRNIVRFIDLDRDDDLYFIVMEWLEGQTLADILDDTLAEKMDLQTALDIVKQIARALGYAHRRGVVHADVKPGNIIITPTGLAKLFDFGVARVRQKENEGKSKFDQDVMEANTPAYSSMQVLTGEIPVAADDVFSLGCLMYRLVADHRVFGPRNAADAAAEGMEPQQPPGLNPVQWRALKKALSYSRVTRFETPADFVKALEPSAKSEPPDDETMVADYDDAPRRSPWRIVLVAAIILASLAVIVQPNLPGIFGDVSESDPAAATVEPVELPEVADDESQPVAAEPAPLIVEAETEFAPEGMNTEPEIVQEESGVEAAVADVSGSPGVTEPAAAHKPQLASVQEPPPAVPVVDFSNLPPATLTIALAANARPVSLALRENTAPAIVDLFRTDGSAEERTVVLAESGFNGSGSAQAAGLYTLENDGEVSFAAGQDRARIQVAMPSNQLREPDRQVTLQIQDAGAIVGVIDLTLEDDDQRAFDARVPANTIAFTETQIFASESDTAVQIDAVRYKPDNTAVEVAYLVRDMTATEGADYFAPALTVIYFGPGQGAARVLIPLTQDAERETDEVFMLELLTDTPLSDPDIFQRIAVMIRDDDS